MIICSCSGTTDRDFRQAVREAGFVLPAQCRAGKECGSCLPTLLRILEEERRKHAAAREGRDDRPPGLREG